MKKRIAALLACTLLGTAAMAESIYYVNPDGGKYIHADRQCDSMSEKYWAGLESITQEEAARRGLERCSRCAQEEQPPVNLPEGDPVYPQKPEDSPQGDLYPADSRESYMHP